MATCRHCGAPLQEGMRFCSECGAAADSASVRMAPPRIEYPADNQRKKKKSIFRRWWFWVLALIVIGSLAGRPGVKAPSAPTERQTAPAETTAPQATPKPTPAPTVEPAPEPSAEPTPEVQVTLSENEIRPEIKEFLDAYEVFVDEYVDFMQKYLNADPTSMAEMLGDYYSFLSRYTEFEEQLDAFSESELTDAELAYYLETTGRVSQKLLSVAW